MVTINYNEAEKTLNCIFSGQLNTATSALVGDSVNQAITTRESPDDAPEKAGMEVVFDLKEVTFISSSFIRICVATAKQVTSDHFKIINCDPFIKKTFKIVGLDDILHVI